LKKVENKGKSNEKAKAIDQVVTSFGLHSGLRQGGGAFGALFIRRAEALRFRSECSLESNGNKNSSGNGNGTANGDRGNGAEASGGAYMQRR
jgi:hypothetical protein